MNNKFLLAAACAIALMVTACVKTYGSDEDIANLKDMLENSRREWNGGNIKGFMQYYLKSNQTQFITKKGILQGWQETLEKYQKAYPDKASMGYLEFTTDTVRVLSPSDGLGQIAGHWKLIRPGDTASGYFSLITKNTQLGPRIIIDHTW